MLEKLLARRIVNAWLVVHCAEIEAAQTRDPAGRKAVETLVGKADRRMLAAVRELAVVRRLQAPVLMARIEAAAR